MRGAALLQPDFRAVIPLMPAPMVKQDGTEKNDGARQAAKRCIAKRRQAHPPLKGLIPADALSSKVPHSETLHADGYPYILGVKEGDHASLFQQGQAAAAGRGTCYARPDRAAGLVPRFRFVNAMPLKGSRTDGRGKGIADWEVSPAQGHPCGGGDGPAGKQAPCLHTHAGGPGTLEDRK
jgi:hypothetical protein